MGGFGFRPAVSEDQRARAVGPRARRADPAVPLYEALARRFADSIRAGAFRPGDRLPSMRALRSQEGVSTATVTQALARLESLGLVESRPRAGYFVRIRHLAPAPEPTRPRPTPRPVTITALLTRISESNRDGRLFSLGPAVPSPELLPVPALARALAAVSRASVGGAMAYEKTAGADALRRAIARRAVTWGFAGDPGEVVVTAGATEAVYLALRAVAQPGDSVAIESPAYYGTLKALEALGLRAIEVPCRPETGLDLDALEEILERQRPAAVLAVPNFSNPSGSLMPEAAKRRLARMIAERDVPLVEDDVYGDLSFARGRPPCVKAFDREGRVLTCSSFSKTLVPGWRVGCIFPGRYRESVLLHKFALNMCTSSAPQHAVARFLDSGSYDRHLRRMCAAVAATARQMGAVITATFPEGTRVSRPSGGLVLWVELPRAVDALELYRQALDAGISLVPGHLFGPHGGYERFVRLSCAHPWGDPVRRAVETVGRLATRLQGAR